MAIRPYMKSFKKNHYFLPILKNISPSVYKEQKRGENAKDWEKNLKKF